jgi:type 1 glutamine amidotransferase
VRVFIWAGLKTHGVGLHDYPQFLTDWASLLTERGAIVDGALHMPSAADLEHTDVIVLYKGDAGYLTDGQKTVLEAYVKRGGGIVVLHDSGCGPDPAYFSTIIGGAKLHGEVNYASGLIRYTVVDKADPIMKEMSDISIQDESFYSITWAKDPPVHVLATTVIPPRASRAGGQPPQGAEARAATLDHTGEVVPQMWTYEHTLPGGQPARAFVWMQGHSMTNFLNYQIQRTLLRGIAWAGKRPVDELVNYVNPAASTGAPARGGGRGGQ